MSDEPASTTVSPDSEPCPTPLAWQEVVQAFDQQAVIRTFDADACELDVTEFGSGPPLLCLPGLTGTPRLFALTAWLLREEFRCILVDHPRWKQRPRDDRLIPETTDVIAAVARHLAPDGLDLLATTYGGQVALDLMHREPATVRRAVLQSCWACRTLTRTERMLLRVGKHLSRPIQKVPLWLSTQVQNHRRWFPPFDETRFGFLLNQAYQTPAREVSRRLLASAATDLRPVLPALEHPIRIVRCEGEGKLIGLAQDELQQGLPHATVDEMHTTGLFPYLTHPHRLVKILRAHFAD